jgi:hypothetical protein
MANSTESITLAGSVQLILGDEEQPRHHHRRQHDPHRLVAGLLLLPRDAAPGVVIPGGRFCARISPITAIAVLLLTPSAAEPLTDTDGNWLYC